MYLYSDAQGFNGDADHALLLVEKILTSYVPEVDEKMCPTRSIWVELAEEAGVCFCKYSSCADVDFSKIRSSANCCVN